MALIDLPPSVDALGHASTWRRLSVAAGGLPDWVARTALAETLSRALLVTAAASVAADCRPGGCTDLLAVLAKADFFEDLDEPDQPDVGVRVLRPEVRKAMLSQLDREEQSPAQIRQELMRAGLGRPECGLGVQLAIWAYEARDWQGLEAIWATHPSGDLVSDSRSRAAYALAPSERRSELPGLSYARALSSAYDPAADRVDLDRMTTALIHDGRTLHSRWAYKATAEAQVVAGTLWMMAQATIPEVADDPKLDGPMQTYLRVGQVVREASLSGSRVSARAMSLFHASASFVAALRADWARARREAELGMILSENCSFPGFLAALVAATSSSASGNTQYFTMGDRYLARHAAHNCRAATWIEPGFHLAWADAATRTLDRELAETHLRLHEGEGATSRWFNIQPVQAMIMSTAATIWHDPERALAEFDSIVAESTVAVDHTTPWGPLLLRARAELLLGLGAVSGAELIVEDLLAHAADSVSAVPAARLYLTAGDFDRAVITADAGIYSADISLSDRAHLYAIRAAALRLGGGSGDAVARAATAACVVCEQAATLVPLAMVPAGVRGLLVAEHDRHHEGEGCFVTRARDRGAFSTLRDDHVPGLGRVRLTGREEVLLPLLATRATVQEIADQEFVSVNTVRKQVVSMREKLGVSTRGALIRRAHELGLLSMSAQSERRD